MLLTGETFLRTRCGVRSWPAIHNCPGFVYKQRPGSCEHQFMFAADRLFVAAKYNKLYLAAKLYDAEWKSLCAKSRYVTPQVTTTYCAAPLPPPCPQCCLWL
ncbi:hypothetical protein E2C01_066463 [Portunus trituberculatus]|uniref:Uncharacterized protein n=1 Tax=Portunus trituberculatus TaxID=210409 RepID=A0A5B7HR03_PORTR|nr:hypothetical protein [Portunus trituberculatus]